MDKRTQREENLEEVLGQMATKYEKLFRIMDWAWWDGHPTAVGIIGCIRRLAASCEEGLALGHENPAASSGGFAVSIMDEGSDSYYVSVDLGANLSPYSVHRGNLALSAIDNIIDTSHDSYESGYRNGYDGGYSEAKVDAIRRIEKM